LIEVPLLSFGVVSPSLEPDVVGTVALNHSSEWKLGLDVEWSVHVETKGLVKTLSLFLFSLIKIDNLPLLMLSSTVTPNSNCLAFLVLSAFNFKDFAALPVDELAVLILENLEPS